MSDFNSYQRSASKTAIYPLEHKILYPALGLAGEAGEVANKVKKLIRDGVENAPKDWGDEIASEIGDVVWLGYRFHMHRTDCVHKIQRTFGLRKHSFDLVEIRRHPLGL